MIAMRAVYSTAPLRAPLCAVLLLAVCGLATCAPAHFPPGHPMTTPSPAVPSHAASSVAEPSQTDDHFIMADGSRLPYRAWLPECPPPVP